MVFWTLATLLAMLFAISGGEQLLETAKPLWVKVAELIERKVPIPVYFKVVEESENGRNVDSDQEGETLKKHVVLYTKKRGFFGGKQKEEVGKLFPLDLSAFILHGLAEDGDELVTEFDQQDNTNFLATHIRHTTPSGKIEHEQHDFIIHPAGGIGYIQLSEARKKEAVKVVGSEPEEKLYYVRVPFNLFPELDGKVLQAKTGVTFHGYTIKPNNCYTEHWQPGGGSIRDCLVLLQDTPNNGPQPTKVLATPLEVPRTLPTRAKNIGGHSIILEANDRTEYFITAKEVARIEMPWMSPSLFKADPSLASQSHVQYVVAVSLDPPTQFNRMEPEFVEKRGRLDKVTRKNAKEVEVKVGKDIIILPISCKPYTGAFCVRNSFRGKIMGKEHYSERMGVTYLLE